MQQTKHRGLARTKRDGVEAVNDASRGISIKELATLYLKFRTCGRAGRDRFVLIFLASFFLSKKKNEVGFGASPV
jgi:hypothetical protein